MKRTRQSPALIWPPTQALPCPACGKASEFINLKHYKYKSKQTITRRCQSCLADIIFSPLARRDIDTESGVPVVIPLGYVYTVCKDCSRPVIPIANVTA